MDMQGHVAMHTLCTRVHRVRPLPNAIPPLEPPGLRPAGNGAPRCCGVALPFAFGAVVPLALVVVALTVAAVERVNTLVGIGAPRANVIFVRPVVWAA